MAITADVVIGGGGIVGSSIAYHLTAAGCRNVLVLERESQQGKGSTGKSMGGVRAQFSTRESIRMSMYSIPFFRDFEARLGHPSGYRPQGYLFVASEDRHMAYLKTNLALHRDEGLSTARLVTREEIGDMVPQLRLEGVKGGSFCSTDGFVDPHSVMTGFMQAATREGARLERGAPVTGLDFDENGICGLETATERIKTRIFVNAGGAWASSIAKMAAIDLPVEPLRRMLVPTEPFDKISHTAPMTIDMSSGFHFRPEGLGFLMAWNDPQETPGYKTEFDRSFVEKILSRAVNFAPVFEEVEVNPGRAWAGLYEMTPDHHPILGPVPEVPGLFLANGFSGHGVMHSPATGKILADVILTGKTNLIDIDHFRLSRFQEGKLIEETAVL
jgi:sarcosine oxidase subunit beta